MYATSLFGVRMYECVTDASQPAWARLVAVTRECADDVIERIDTAQ